MQIYNMHKIIIGEYWLNLLTLFRQIIAKKTKPKGFQISMNE